MSLTSTNDKVGPTVLTGLPQTIPVFAFQTASDLLVLDTGPASGPFDPAVVLTLGSDYSVSGGGYNGANQMQTGSVTLNSGGTGGVAINDNIVVMRNVPVNQPTSLIETGPLTVALVEHGLDRQATLSQQLTENVSRALQFEDFEFLSGVLTKSQRAGKVLAFDDNGNISYIGQQGIAGDASAETVIATGSTTARSLAKRFSNPINILDYGADPTGTNDSTAAIQNAVNKAGTGNGSTTSRGAVVIAPSGVYKFSAVQLLPGVSLVGQGSNTTIFSKTSTTSLGIFFDNTGYTPQAIQDTATVEGLSIEQVGAATAGAGISFNSVSSDCQGIVRDVIVKNCFVGIILNSTISSRIDTVNVYNSVSHGYHIFGGTTLLNITNAFASGCGSGGTGSGFFINQVTGGVISGCGSDLNHDNGYLFQNCTSLNLVGSDNEGNPYGAYLLGCNGVILDNFYTNVGAATISAVILDGGTNNELINLNSNVGSTLAATYLVSTTNSPTLNKLSVGVINTTSWPGSLNGGLFDSITPFTSVRAGPYEIINRIINWGTAAQTFTFSDANTITIPYFGEVYGINASGKVRYQSAFYGQRFFTSNIQAIFLDPNQNLCINSAVPAGDSVGNLIMIAGTAPTSTQAGNGQLYIDPSDSKLKWRGPSGTVTILANP